MADTNLPQALFPGLSARDIVSDDVRELVVTFNAEGLEALRDIPEENVRWADIGTRVTKGSFEAKIPIALHSLLGFKPFTGERAYNQVGVAAVSVKSTPLDLNFEWDIRYNSAGAPLGLAQYYGLQGLPATTVANARAAKADMLASLIMAGQTNSSLGMTATALTLAQPGYATGLPLFSDGSTSGASKHYSNPIDSASRTFANLFLNQGKITDTGVFETMLTNMRQVPHPMKLNMNLGIGVTDVIGGTNMLGAFRDIAVRQLSLQTITYSGSDLAAATSNLYTAEALQKAQQFITASGQTVVRYHIAPQLDFHPYLIAHPTAHMWFAVSSSNRTGSWAEFIAPETTFTPRITILGDGSEEAAKSRKVRMIGDLDAGVAAGLPHFIQAYFETTP